MRLIHISDLHIGKRVNEFSMLEDQQYILTEIINIIEKERASDRSTDGIIIAGDVYDKSVPSAEAVSLFDDFLVKLSEKNIPVFIISGNHDSAERVAFASRLMSRSGVYVSPVYDGKITPVTLADEHGETDIWLLPFIKPGHVRAALADDPAANDIQSYTDAMAAAIQQMDIDPSKRNVLVTHQFVTGSTRCESEEISIGGSDNVDAAVFEVFDYVALGHLHGPQNAYGPRVRYCGSPLKYSFSEAKHKKSVTIVELGAKDSGAIESDGSAGEVKGYADINIETVELVPLRDMIEIKGTYDQVISPEFYSQYDTKAYFHITLTDEEDVPNALGNLRVIYPNLMKLDYDNSRTRAVAELVPGADAESISPLELFGEFYEKQNGRELSEIQTDYLADIIEQIWRGES